MSHDTFRFSNPMGHDSVVSAREVYGITDEGDHRRLMLKGFPDGRWLNSLDSVAELHCKWMEALEAAA